VAQTERPSRIFIVDDGSREQVRLPEWARYAPTVRLLRLDQNEGISAARNTAISLSAAPFLACVNAEVLPDREWMANCLRYLDEHPKVGACYTRTVPQTPNRLLTRWRMRFQEPRYPQNTGPSEFAHGHAVLFRREAIDAVGGYDVRYRLHNEDSDICKRMWRAGWETHFLQDGCCVSIQQDSLADLASKQLRDTNWHSPQDSLFKLYLHLTKWTLVRAGRNLARGRLHFLPIDLALWGYALCLATDRTIRALLKRRIELDKS
jgi:cellulose synthase/poly-beta-1,6-N-acetylglucosamine synthase-like glycosyltransferase